MYVKCKFNIITAVEAVAGCAQQDSGHGEGGRKVCRVGVPLDSKVCRAGVLWGSKVSRVRVGASLEHSDR